MTLQQTEQKKYEERQDVDHILRRNNRGCKSEDFYNWPELPFDDMDSPLAVQQYIQQLIRRDPSDIRKILELPEGQELGAWKIEHLRLFCMQLNSLATKLQDCCQPETCNQMTATEQWIFLCAAHKQPNECPAIDYTRHTLDGAASLLNSNKYFPSRVTIKESSVAKLGSVCRRVYRIFSHAYYHHFQVFDEFERTTHLCKRFSEFVTMYQLMSKESLIVPSDGSKPEVEIQPATNPDQQSNSADVLKQEATVIPSTGQVETSTQIRADTNIKKSSNEETSSNKSATTSAPWTISQNSTNTIVKGSAANVSIFSASKGNLDEPGVASKATTESPITIPTNVSSTISGQDTSSKAGVESEA